MSSIETYGNRIGGLVGGLDPIKSSGGFKRVFGPKSSSNGFELSAPSSGLACWKYWTGAVTLGGGSGDGKSFKGLSEFVDDSLLLGSG